MDAASVGAVRIRNRAVAVVRRDGWFLLHIFAGDDFWSLPGGGVDPGETGADAIRRELAEELGLPAEIGPLICVAENFFVYRGRPKHEVGFYYDVTIPDLPGPPQALASREGHLSFRWFRDDELAGIDLKPVAVRDLIAGGEAPLCHLIVS